MTTHLEDELVQTLAGAANHAPEPDGEFVDGVRRRQRSRRHRRVAVLAGCAAVLMVVSGIAVTKLAPQSSDVAPVGGRGALPVRDAPWSGTVPDFAKAETPDKVWPEAVHKLPARLPGGGAYRVYEVLGDDIYLVQQLAKPGAPSVLNARTGDVRFLGDKSQAGPLAPEVADWATTVIGDNAVWFIHEGSDVFQIWTAPLDGSGDPRRITTLVDVYWQPSITLTGSEIYWYLDSTERGLFRLAVPDGDSPEAVAGGETYAPIDLSPWASTSRNGFTEDLSLEGTLWNLETGERRPWRAAPDIDEIRCFPLLCWGWTRPGREQFLQSLDGSRVVELTFPRGGFDLTPAVDGGFGVGFIKTQHGDHRYVWDFATGKAATVKITGQDEVVGGFQESTLQWPASDTEIYVLDLAAIR